jgi:hypothetical protein
MSIKPAQHKTLKGIPHTKQEDKQNHENIIIKLTFIEE